jgi:hypothetical protein
MAQQWHEAGERSQGSKEEQRVQGSEGGWEHVTDVSITFRSCE